MDLFKKKKSYIQQNNYKWYIGKYDMVLENRGGVEE